MYIYIRYETRRAKSVAKKERDGREGRGICTRPREKQSFPRVCIKLDGAFNFVESVPRAWRSVLVGGCSSCPPLCGTPLHQQPGWHQCPRSKTRVKRRSTPRCHDKLPTEFVERDTLTLFPLELKVNEEFHSDNEYP